MPGAEIFSRIKERFPDLAILATTQNYSDEVCLEVKANDFKNVCLGLHKMLLSPVMMFFATDERQEASRFVVHCVFLSAKTGPWVKVSTGLGAENPCFETLAKNMYSASLFEREIWEMFGIEPKGNPDLRRLHLHDEVWPSGNFPLRKDFQKAAAGTLGSYKFSRVEGDGIFEVPVGPVHAGIIGPGHFRFSVAGEPIVNLETRFGFTHRGVEKLFEGKTVFDALRFSECVAGDSVIGHSLAFVCAAEKIFGVSVPVQAQYLRGIFLELERMVNHANDLGGIAIDVSFSFPAALASLIKEEILQMNEQLTQNRYLKKINDIGGVRVRMDQTARENLSKFLQKIKKDFKELVGILYGSVSFMDRVDSTGVLKKKTAEDLGVVGLCARASALGTDLRKHFPGICKEAKFKMMVQESGDVLARVKVRVDEFEESCRLIEYFLGKLLDGGIISIPVQVKEGSALGYAEGWRGPVLYWLKVNDRGFIERCKIVDPSFHNWQGLTYAVLGNIIPDFPLCNKSFDLSYSGNDL